MSCGSQKHNLSWPQKPGAQGIFPIWVAHDLLLWWVGLCLFLWSISKEGRPLEWLQGLHGCWCMVASVVNCPVSCEDWMRLKFGQSSQWGTSTGANRLQMKFQMALAGADISKVTQNCKTDSWHRLSLYPVTVPTGPCLSSICFKINKWVPTHLWSTCFQFGVLCCCLGRVCTWVY